MTLADRRRKMNKVGPANAATEEALAAAEQRIASQAGEIEQLKYSLGIVTERALQADAAESRIAALAAERDEARALHDIQRAETLHWKGWFERTERELAEARKALDAFMGWRPIDSAPKDGTHILVNFYDGEGLDHRIVVRWGGCLKNEFNWRAIPGEERWANRLATHWRTLPAPPAKE